MLSIGRNCIKNENKLRNRRWYYHRIVSYINNNIVKCVVIMKQKKCKTGCGMSEIAINTTKYYQKLLKEKKVNKE